MKTKINGIERPEIIFGGKGHVDLFFYGLQRCNNYDMRHQAVFCCIGIDQGEGLLFFGDTIIPFIDRFPKDTRVYDSAAKTPYFQLRSKSHISHPKI